MTYGSVSFRDQSVPATSQTGQPFSRYQPESCFIDYKQKSSGKKLVHIIFQTNQLDLLKVVTTMKCFTLVSLTKNVREFINL